jgi:D-tyrosyl-tRNA(Tyr) deacylase
MKAVIQRVSRSSVEIGGELEAEIEVGLNVLVGVGIDDSMADVEWLAAKIAALRIFNDENGQMNLSVNQVKGEVLVISQFTLHAKTKKGTRPSYIKAAKPDIAIPLYENFLKEMKSQIEGRVLSGKFGADMKVEIQNDGPVTIVIDTKNKE